MVEIKYKSVKLTVWFDYVGKEIEITSIETESGDDITTLFDTTANEIEKLVFEKLEQIKEDDR